MGKAARRAQSKRSAGVRGQPKGRRGAAADRNAFPIVGVGASAGGLEAFGRLLQCLPADTGMAFLLVQHLDPKHESRLPEILSRATTMPVAETEDGARVKRDHVYVIPPNTNMSIRDGVLNLAPRTDSPARHLPVDFLLRSLARARRNRAVGVILSGTASDGAAGMKAIKAHGGVTFAQDSASAKYFGMPGSSIATGSVDFVLPPEAIAERLAMIGQHHPKRADSDKPEVPPARDHGDALSRLLQLLKKTFGVDFGAYKASTVNRRIRRRMALRGIRAVEDYLQRVRTHPDELKDLYRDMFIGVTGFFREPETFDALKKRVFPRILRNRSVDAPIRIWVPGCSTGEEVYSIAISLLEHMNDRVGGPPVRIFGTDINEEAVQKARQGKYRRDIAPEVGRSRLRRFFLKTDEGYQVSKAVRDLCVFAKHDIINDPPFSRLDLLSCRNVLIYLGAPLQRKLLPLFHHSLKASGFLLLGTAETVGGFGDLFALVDGTHRIYVGKTAAGRPRIDLSPGSRAEAPALVSPRVASAPRADFDVERDAADQILLSQYAPAAVLVDEDLEILHFRGHTGAYLEPSPGVASLKLLKMAREGLLLALQAATETARKKGVTARANGLRIHVGGRERLVNLQVVPVKAPNSRRRTFLVLFEDVTPGGPARAQGKAARPGPAAAERARDQRVVRLRQEMAATKAYLQSGIQSQEAANEELRSLNEELESTNEELQSTTEEMETANEELQSANEELTTLNEELHHRNAELAQAHSDIANVLGSMDLSLIIVDRKLRIRRSTPKAQAQLGLPPAEASRSLTDVRLGAEISDLERLITGVMESGGQREVEFQYRDGRWQLLQVRPYVTAEGKVDGAVVALSDIHERRVATDRLRAFVESAPDAMVIVDSRGTISLVNAQTERLFGYSRDELCGQPLEILVPSRFREGHRAHRDVFMKGPTTRPMGSGLELWAVRRDGQEFPVEISLSPIETGEGVLVSSIIRDIGDRKQLEADSRRAAVLEERNRLAREVHDSLAQGLTGIVVQLEGAEDVLASDPQEARKHLVQARALARSSLEEARRSLSALRSKMLEEGDLPASIRRIASGLTANSRIKAELSVRGQPRRLPPESEEQLLHIAQEALTNAVRHARARRIRAHLTYEPDTIRMRIEDDGRGLAGQAPGAGLGLSIMKERAERIGAQIAIGGHSGKGTRVAVVLRAPASRGEPVP